MKRAPSVATRGPAVQRVDPTLTVPSHPRLFEYRVVYRRADWLSTSSNQSRLFQSRDAADTFADRLLAGGRPDLARLTVLRIDRRPVGRWKTVWVARGPGRP